MPAGVFGAARMTQLKDLTDADLEREFREMERVTEEDETEGSSEAGGAAPTSSSPDRPSSSDSLKTGSDLHSEDTGSNGEHNMPEAESKREKHSRSSVWQSVKKAGGELNQDTRRVFRYIGQKLHSRHGPKETKVKKIHILPDGDEDRWARRTAGSANSCSSSGSDQTT